MININEVKTGDFLIVDNDGDKRRGEVTELNFAAKQVCINNGVQDFWYEENQLFPLPISDEELLGLKFHREVNADGTVKYSKGAFRILVPAQNDFSRMEVWYRDEHRHLYHSIPLHILQNHFLEMTKVHLNQEVFD